jgi:hypothetical protein
VLDDFATAFGTKARSPVDYWNGSMDGAISSGERAAGEVPAAR